MGRRVGAVEVPLEVVEETHLSEPRWRFAPPHEVAEWVREQRRTASSEPLTVERSELSIVVHFVDEIKTRTIKRFADAN